MGRKKEGTAMRPSRQEVAQARQELCQKAWPGATVEEKKSQLGALTTGKVTQKLREVGLLSEAEMLITLKDPQRIRDICAWWEHTGEAAFVSTTKSGMNAWVRLHKTPAEESTSELPTIPQVRLAPPPHGVRAWFLIRDFVNVLSADHIQRDQNAEWLIRALVEVPTSGTGKKVREELWKSCTVLDDCREGMREHTALFRRLRKAILFNLETHLETVNVRLRRDVPAPVLRQACRDVLARCLQQQGGAILKDLKDRPQRLENSIWNRLEYLHSAAQSEDTTQILNAWLALLRSALEDSDPLFAGEVEGLAPGQAVREDGFWKSGLLWNLLTKCALPPAALEVLLQLEAPGHLLPQVRLHLFYCMCAMGKRVGGKRNQASRELAMDWSGRAKVYLSLHWDQLKRLLPVSGTDTNAAVPDSWLIGRDGRHDRTMFWARLSVAFAETALDCVPGSSRHRAGFYLMTALEELRTAEGVLRERVEAGLRLEEEIAGRYELHMLWGRLYLCRAECYLQLARQEEEENSLEDAVRSYIRPAREALCQADGRIQEIPGNVRGVVRLKAGLTQLTGQCVEEFFDKNAPVLSRMGLRAPENRKLYTAERKLWQNKLWQEEKKIVLPRVIPQIKTETLRSADSFDTVYCGVFDSVPGKNLSYKETMELQFFQMLASGKVCLLQMNQIVDNWAMLNLMPTPGFRQACREGIVTLSCFNEIDDPKEYLRMNLQNPNFRFSSTELYALPDGAGDADVERSLRSVMLHYLETGDRIGFREQIPYEWREHATFLIDAYAILFECFQPADLLRYHQNASRRIPPGRMPPGGQKLDTVLKNRLGRLVREAEEGDPTKNLDVLRALQEYTRKWPNLTNRSQYDNQITQALKAAGEEEQWLLNKFRKLVDQCYFLSNGHRSCDTVLLTETDPDLVRRGEMDGRRADNADCLTRIMRQYKRPAGDSNLAWSDLCGIALIVREIDRKEKKLQAQERALMKEKYTGLLYSVAGNDAIASDLSPRTSDGAIYRIAEADKGTEVLEVHRAGG